MTDEVITPVSAYKDDDLVYVDPDTRTVVGMVEWNKNGNPKSMPVKEEAAAPEGTPATDKKGDKKERRRSGRKYYPWGTYKSMKNIYRLEGKQKKTEPNKTLDQVIDIALEQPFWD
jgi:hypothetical protein